MENHLIYWRGSTIPTYKNIRIPKRGGGSRLQRVQVLASGKYKFVKNKPSTRKTTQRKRGSKSTSRRVNRSARQITVPMALVSGVAATTLGANKSAGASNTTIAHLQRGDWNGALIRTFANWTGYHMNEGFDFMKHSNLLPLFVGGVVHIIASKLGINRMLGRARVPFIRI